MAQIKKWKQLKSRIIFEHPRITLVEDDVELPNGQTAQYLKFGGSGRRGVTIICMQGGKVLLQQEYSYPVDEIMYQFPGGGVDKNESAAQAATRELIEESGLKPNNLKELGWYYVDNRRTDAKMYVMLAENVTAQKKQGGDAEEIIESEWIAVDKFKRMVRDGQIVNF